MKKLSTVLALAAVAFVLSSCCGGENPKLSASKAKSIVNKEAARVHADVATVGLAVGYYECNDDATRYKLRQLAANEVITYGCDRVQKVVKGRHSRRVQRNYWGYTYYDTEYYYGNDTVTTYFVTVALTDKGRKMVVEELPEPKPTADEKDLMPGREVDMSKLPEANVSPIEFPDGTETTDEASAAAQQQEYAESVEEAVPGQANEQPVAGAEDKSAYDMAKEKESVEHVALRSHNLKTVKVRNIAVSYAGVPSAKAEVVVECSGVTPFGRIMAGAVEGERNIIKAGFTYYQDKHWTLNQDID